MCGLCCCIPVYGVGRTPTNEDVTETRSAEFPATPAEAAQPGAAWKAAFGQLLPPEIHHQAEHRALDHARLPVVGRHAGFRRDVPPGVRLDSFRDAPQ